MTDELSDKDSFADDEEVDEENLISPAMVKKVTYLIHKLAEQKGKDYKDIQKKCRNMFKYENLAKISKEQGHAIINKLIELTGGEEEKPQLPTKPDDGLKNKGAKVTDEGNEHLSKSPDKNWDRNKDVFSDNQKEVAKIAVIMKFTAREANTIVAEELQSSGLSESNKAQLIERFAVTLFIEAMKRGLGR